MEVHDKIRVLREVNQWTQEDMAEKLDMSPNGYAKIERGQSNINLDKLQQIANIFEINIVDLFTKNDKSFFFSIGDNTSNHNYVGVDERLVLENEKYKALLLAKEELITQKDNEISALKQIIDLMQEKNG